MKETLNSVFVFLNLFRKFQHFLLKWLFSVLLVLKHLLHQFELFLLYNPALIWAIASPWSILLRASYSSLHTYRLWTPLHISVCLIRSSRLNGVVERISCIHQFVERILGIYHEAFWVVEGQLDLVLDRVATRHFVEKLRVVFLDFAVLLNRVSFQVGARINVFRQ